MLEMKCNLSSKKDVVSKISTQLNGPFKSLVLVTLDQSGVEGTVQFKMFQTNRDSPIRTSTNPDEDSNYYMKVVSDQSGTSRHYLTNGQLSTNGKILEVISNIVRSIFDELDYDKIERVSYDVGMGVDNDVR